MSHESLPVPVTHLHSGTPSEYGEVSSDNLSSVLSSRFSLHTSQCATSMVPPSRNCLLTKEGMSCTGQRECPQNFP